MCHDLKYLILVFQFCLGETHLCFIESDGTLNCWSRNPLHIPSVEEAAEGSWAEVACGDRFTCAIRHDGILKCWADEKSTFIHDIVVSAMPAVDKWRRIVAKHRVVCGIDVSDALHCWGFIHSFGSKFEDGDVFEETPAPPNNPRGWEDVFVTSTTVCGLPRRPTFVEGAIPISPCWGQGSSMKLQRNVLTAAGYGAEYMVGDFIGGTYAYTSGNTTLPSTLMNEEAAAATMAWGCAIQSSNRSQIICEETNHSPTFINIGEFFKVQPPPSPSGPWLSISSSNLFPTFCAYSAAASLHCFGSLEFFTNSTSHFGNQWPGFAVIDSATMMRFDPSLRGTFFSAQMPLKSLRILGLDDWNLTAIPHIADQSPFLTELSLNYNNLYNVTAFQQAIGVQPHLLTMSITDNEFTSLPVTNTMAPSLVSLTVSRNPINGDLSLPFPFLGILEADGIGLAALMDGESSLFSDCDLLGVLSLNNNYISDIPDGAIDFLNLKTLSVANNPITHIGPLAYDSLSRTSSVILRGTPLANLSQCEDNTGFCLGFLPVSQTFFCSRMQSGEYCIWGRGPAACEPGYACKDGERSPCPIGSVSAASSSECFVCNSGYYANDAGSHCIGCEAGYACLRGVRTRCPTMTYAPEQSEDCLPCQNGTYSTGGRESCQPCDSGFACQGNERLPCPLNTFSPGSSDQCFKCPPGQYSGARASACFSCPDGTAIFITNSSGIEAATCAACPPGTTYQASTSPPSCAPCPAGHQCGGGVAEPQVCPPGSFSDEDGAANCTPCPTGRFAMSLKSTSATARSQNLTCMDCPIGRFTDTGGALRCSSCPLGRTATVLPPDSDVKFVNATVACTECPEGMICGPGLSAPLTSLWAKMKLAVTPPTWVPSINFEAATEGPRYQVQVVELEGPQQEFFESTPTGVVVPYIIGGVLAGLTLVMSVIFRKRFFPLLQKLDMYGVERPIPPKHPISSEPSGLGGLVTIIVSLVGASLLLSALVEYDTNANRSTSSTVRPSALLPSTDISDYGWEVFFYVDTLPLGGAGSFRCEDVQLQSRDDLLPSASCASVPRTNSGMYVSTANIVACTCSTSSEGPRPLLVDSSVFLEVPIETVELTWRATVRSARGALRALSKTPYLRPSPNVPTTISVTLAGVSEFLVDQVNARNFSGAELVYVSEDVTLDASSPRTAFRPNDRIKFVGLLQSSGFGFETTVQLKTTFMEALSSSISLILGFFGTGGTVVYMLRWMQSKKNANKVENEPQVVKKKLPLQPMQRKS